MSEFLIVTLIMIMVSGVFSTLVIYLSKDDEIIEVMQESINTVDKCLKTRNRIMGKKDCTDCLLDGTDACSRGAGRAVNDKICKDFFRNKSYK